MQSRGLKSRLCLFYLVAAQTVSFAQAPLQYQVNPPNSVECAGNTVQISISTSITLATSNASEVTVNSAISGGNVANDGGNAVSQRGVCWSISPNPTTANFSTSDGSGLGNFTSNLTGLSPNTTYYVRAYATNSAGTFYGNEVSFITSSAGSGTYPPGSVFCNGTPTAVVDVTNPATGRIWMDRNLGATQAATSGNDAAAYGDLYQWGRRSDGHQCRNSAITSTLSSTDQPVHGNFISNTDNSGNLDWRSPQNNNLWQGVNGINNPCPSAYRLPTETELNAERLSWSQNNSSGAFASPLKLPVAGLRGYGGGSFGNVGASGSYWSSTVNGTYSNLLNFLSSNAYISYNYRASGLSVRCLKDISQLQGAINTIDCGSATNIGTLTQGTAASGVSSIVPYIGGNGGTHSGQIVTSTGVTGLTATLEAGTFANGAGNLTYTITGTPSASGTASFALNIGGQSCTFSVYVNYPAGSVFCTSGPTAIVDVTNPTTGRIWMDRNLGASQAATSSTDAAAYGDLYQWGRRSDGHQCRNSATTSTLSSTDQPGHGDFIIASSDWRSPANGNLWQGINGVNNPCPSGYRLPSSAEFFAERSSWSNNNAASAFDSPLKFPSANVRFNSSVSTSLRGFYWSSSPNAFNSLALWFTDSNSNVSSYQRYIGGSVRCIKN